jgi:ubiquinone/menaquinone biosynthesis C-methylase UbiE
MGPRVLAERDRQELLEGLTGRVLEVGAGDGLNFQHYPDTVASVLAVEPEPRMRGGAEPRAYASRVRIAVVDGTAEQLPAADGSCDAAVACLVLCSVDDQARALDEIRRVLRPGGELRFYEHVAAHGRVGAAVQRGLDRSGVWPCLGGGCHLTRDTQQAITAAGFAIERCRAFGMGLGPVRIPHIAGRARRR